MSANEISVQKLQEAFRDNRFMVQTAKENKRSWTGQELQWWWLAGAIVTSFVLAVTTWSVNKDSLPSIKLTTPQQNTTSALPSTQPIATSQSASTSQFIPEGSYVAVYMSKDGEAIDLEMHAVMGTVPRMQINTDGTGYVNIMGEREDFTFDAARMYTGTGEDDVSDYTWDGQRLIVSEPRAIVEFVPADSQEAQRLLNANHYDLGDSSDDVGQVDVATDAETVEPSTLEE